MTTRLNSFTIASSDDGYTLCLTVGDGQDIVVYATAEQLDDLAEEVDRHLDEDLGIPDSE